MLKYELIETKKFSKLFSKLPLDIKKRFELQFKKVQSDPYGLGKPLKGKDWFRELKQCGFRVYYVISEEKILVIFLGVSNKKSQQKMIDIIDMGLNDIDSLIEKM